MSTLSSLVLALVIAAPGAAFAQAKGAKPAGKPAGGEGELHGCLRPASPGARGPGGARPPEARTVPGRTRATGMAEAACALHPCLGRMRLIDSDVGFNYCQ